MFGSVAGANWPAECGLPSTGASSKQQVWLIFGATGTIGSQICRSVLERGDVVVACSRNVMTSVTVPPEWADRLLTIGCDIRLRSMVKEVVDKTLQRWSRIDVVVNTVSVGVVAPCEEQDEHDVREQFETNVMGLFHIIQTTVPYMRMRGKGRYVIISGIAGMLGVPGMGPFCGTKWAVEGMIETFAYEIEGFGGKATLVYPGTVEEDATTKRAPAWRHFVIKPMGEEYQGTPAEHARRLILWVSAHRATGVAKIGEIIWELAQCKQPPMRLLLGSETVETMRNRLRQNVEEVEDWKFLFTEEE
ncbi:hypothetical protein BZA70DRAFT_123145 [Myxozyma melibiosi]|uniref:Oxidoreductase n=1 Tax=Myxozyma melibiosi TaxID=54550 RepID=A0ABR1F8B3_9ASCO